MRFFVVLSTLVAGFWLIQPAMAGPFSDTIGLQLQSMNTEMHKNLGGTLEKVHQWGFTNVEIVSDYNLSPEGLRAELTAHHLKATSAHFPYPQFRDKTEELAVEGEALGLEYIGCASVPQKEALDEEGALEAARTFNRVGKLMAEHHMRFTYHPHGFEFKPWRDGTLFDVIVTNTDPRYVSFQMDIYWIVHAGQDPIKLFEQYPTRWCSMHLKDMRKGAPTGEFNGHIKRTDFVPIGKGQIDIVAAVRKARQIGITSFFIEDESGHAAKQVPISLEYLKNQDWDEKPSVK